MFQSRAGPPNVDGVAAVFCLGENQNHGAFWGGSAPDGSSCGKTWNYPLVNRQKLWKITIFKVNQL
jgi:hypothetical protein